MTDSLQNRRSTQAPTASIPPFGLRMQSVLKAELEASAEASGRSLNAEIVDRLRQSFEPMFELDPDVLTSVEQYAAKHGVSTKEAVRLLLIAGLQEGGKIIFLNMRSGMSVTDFSNQVQEAATASPGAVVHLAPVEGERRAVGAEVHKLEAGGTVRVVQRITMGNQ